MPIGASRSTLDPNTTEHKGFGQRVGKKHRAIPTNPVNRKQRRAVAAVNRKKEGTAAAVSSENE
jgi:hypothetical protein